MKFRRGPRGGGGHHSSSYAAPYLELIRIVVNAVALVSTVLSGAEERGVDGPSLDRSYFSRLQPISRSYFSIRLRVMSVSV